VVSGPRRLPRGRRPRPSLTRATPTRRIRPAASAGRRCAATTCRMSRRSRSLPRSQRCWSWARRAAHRSVPHGR